MCAQGAHVEGHYFVRRSKNKRQKDRRHTVYGKDLMYVDVVGGGSIIE